MTSLRAKPTMDYKGSDSQLNSRKFTYTLCLRRCCLDVSAQISTMPLIKSFVSSQFMDSQ